MSGDFQDEFVAARYINSSIQEARHEGKMGKPFVFLLAGPPAIGKTFLRTALYSLWKDLELCYIPANCALMERQMRHKLLLGEKTRNVYDLQSLKDILKRVLRFESVRINSYDHKSGLITKNACCLTPSNFVYLENDVWLELLDTFTPDFMVLLIPYDTIEWKKAYIYRNVTFRNYDVTLAEKMFELLYEEWKVHKESSVRADVIFQVKYTGKGFIPRYSIERRTINDKEKIFLESIE